VKATTRGVRSTTRALTWPTGKAIEGHVVNSHEQHIVRVLAERVRVFTVGQIAATWWTDTRWGRSRASAAMRSLADEGWLHVQQALSRPIQLFDTPLVAWRPGEGRPELAAVARSLHRRAMVDAKPVNVAFATTRAATLFCSGRAPSVTLTQMTHDLNVAELFLHYLRSGLPEDRWMSEDRLPRDWPIKARPDALVRNVTGEIVRALEYGGDYPESRLAELHQGLSSIHLAYEIW